MVVTRWYQKVPELVVFNENITNFSKFYHCFLRDRYLGYLYTSCGVPATFESLFPKFIKDLHRFALDLDKSVNTATLKLHFNLGGNCWKSAGATFGE